MKTRDSKTKNKKTKIVNYRLLKVNVQVQYVLSIEKQKRSIFYFKILWFNNSSNKDISLHAMNTLVRLLFSPIFTNCTPWTIRFQGSKVSGS